ncbi:alpha/beta hydrolase [Pantoea sp. B65]|uniref:alpha/beta hydrolase n=1 Tax=Pantoea sp. B65 TaxID=2813359 RepID=UPI0039B548FF
MMPLAMLSPEMAALLAELQQQDAGLADPTTLPAAQGRAQSEQSNVRWNQQLPPMAEVTPFSVSDGRLPALSGTLYTPENAGAGAIIYVHGGGWAFCSAATHQRSARLLAQLSGVPVLLFDYRLAPEHPWPAGLEDTRRLWQQLTSGKLFPHLDRHKLALAGDSAGANLALALMLAQQPDDIRPVCGLLFYGVYGADFTTASYRQCANGPGLTREKMQRYWQWYQPDHQQRLHPLVTPLNASDQALMALPPLWMNAAQVDPLRSDSENLAARLHQLGRRDRLQIVPGVVHGFMQMTLRLPAAVTAHKEAADAWHNLTR